MSSLRARSRSGSKTDGRPYARGWDLSLLGLGLFLLIVAVFVAVTRYFG